MLTGTLVRVRFARQAIVAHYIEPADRKWLSAAEQLLLVYRAGVGNTRAEIEEDLASLIGEGQQQLIHQGLAKLLEDRCEFEVVSDMPPETIREKVFEVAATHRQMQALTKVSFDRQLVLQQVSEQIGLTPEQVDRSLFADMKDEQRILKFDDMTAEQLLHRYNVALAQAVLLRSVGMKVHIWGETPARMRQLLRAMKFRRLIGTVHEAKGKGYLLKLDGPLSLFSSTQRYGLQLALFLPSLLHCAAFELHAEIRWGAQKKEKTFTLSATDGLRSHYADYGVYTPPEFEIFADNFRSLVADWLISSDPNPISHEHGIWVPDFKLTHTPTGREVFLELFGFWRKTDVESLYGRLKSSLPGKFLLIVSETMRADEGEDFTSRAEIYRYKRTPSAEAVARAAAQIAGV